MVYSALDLTSLSRDAADDATWVHTSSSTFLQSQLKLFLCLNCAVYDTIPAMQFIDFFQLNVIDNFNILKINVEFEHQFTDLFQKHLHKLPLCMFSLLILTTCTRNYLGKTF